MQVFDNGKTVQVNVAGSAPSLTIGLLSLLVQRSADTTPQTWTLQQIHLHCPGRGSVMGS